MRMIYKYFLLFFIGVFTDVGEVCAYKGECLPRMTFQSENILFPRFGGWDLVDGTKCGNYDFIINPVERRTSHCAVQFDKASFAVFNICAMSGHNFLFNSWNTNIRAGIEYPFLNGVSWNKTNRLNLNICIKPVGKFPDQFASINNIWCQLHRIRVNILNNNLYPVRATDAHNSTKNFIGCFIKTVAYTS